MELLHIVATPRAAVSNSLLVSNGFLDALRGSDPDVGITTMDLFAADLPSVAGDNIESKYRLMRGQSVAPTHAASWARIEALIEQFLAADVILVSTPMWNFSIPYVLKFYIDCIVQPGYLFNFNEQGVAVGLCTGKRLVCITARGGDYRAGGPMAAHDFQEPYLRTLFGFVGITDQQFIHAQPTDITPELREAAMAEALASAIAVARALVTPAGASSSISA